MRTANLICSRWRAGWPLGGRGYAAGVGCFTSWNARILTAGAGALFCTPGREGPGADGLDDSTALGLVSSPCAWPVAAGGVRVQVTEHTGPECHAVAVQAQHVCRYAALRVV